MSKIKWLSVLLCLVVFNGGLLAVEKQCIVKGKINGWVANEGVQVLRRSGEYGTDILAKAKVDAKGNFIIYLPATTFNEVYELRLNDVRSSISFVSEPGTVTIEADRNKLYAGQVGGTTENNRWNDYQAFQRALSLERNKLNMSGKNKTDEFKAKYYELDMQAKHYTDSMIGNYPNSIVALYLAKMPLPMMKHPQIDSVLTHFKPYFAKHKYYLVMKARADVLRKVAPGAIAPDFNVLQPDGKTKIALSSLRGKYVLLDFWASWCVPCRAENKHTKELYNKYHPYGLEIMSFSLDSDLKAWKEAVEKDELVWHNASDLVGGQRSPVATKYGIDGLPAIWVIDPKGKIIAESIRGEALDQLLNSLLIKK